MRALLAASALLVLLLTGCTAEAPAGPSSSGSGPGSPAHQEAVPRGHAVDVRFPHRQFVPQGLALVGDGTAYVSGYAWEPQHGHRECQVAHVDLETGKVLTFADFFAGRVPAEFCRHGGGIATGTDGVWLAGAGRLWLLDPALLGTGEEVQRIWAIDSSIRASTVARDGGELVFAHFREQRRGTALRFAISDLLDPSTGRLDAAPGGDGLAPTRSRRIPSRVQGLAVGPGGTWLTRSTSYCGELVDPDGHRFPFVPGAEGIAFDDQGRLWTTSESGSGPYQRMGGRPDVPTLTRVDPRRLDRRTEADCW